MNPDFMPDITDREFLWKLLASCEELSSQRDLGRNWRKALADFASAIDRLDAMVCRSVYEPDPGAPLNILDSNHL